MATNIHNILSAKTLEPGQTTKRVWNNAPYDGVERVFVLDIIPRQAKVPGTDQLEITRQWRVLKTNGNSFSNVELELHYEVKNIGNSTATFDVVMAIIT